MLFLLIVYLVNEYSHTGSIRWEYQFEVLLDLRLVFDELPVVPLVSSFFLKSDLLVPLVLPKTINK